MKKNKNGFTLIELLVVISIIALLLSILMPALSVVKERTRRVICGSNQKQLAYSAILYANDYDGKFPLRTAFSAGPEYFALAQNLAPSGGTPNASNVAEDDRHLWEGYVDGYVLTQRGVHTPGYDRAPKVMWCPSMRASRLAPGQFPEGTWPDSGSRTDGWDGYYIGYLYFNLGNNFSDWFTWNNAALKMPERTQDPSYIPLFGDQMCLSRSDVNVWRFATHFRDKAAEGRIAPPDLNPEGMNNAMTDGSVHWFKYTPDLQEPIWISGSSDYVYIWGVR